MPDNLAPYSNRTPRSPADGCRGDLRSDLMSRAVLADDRSQTHGGDPLSSSPGQPWLDSVREFAPAAVVMLRHGRPALGARVAALRAQPSRTCRSERSVVPRTKAAALLELELAMVQPSDVTMAVTEDEGHQIRERRRRHAGRRHPYDPRGRGACSPPSGALRNCCLLAVSSIPLTSMRLSISVHEVMPQVWRRWATCRSRSLAEVRRRRSRSSRRRESISGAGSRISSRCSIRAHDGGPVRYGAGVKGKITQGLAAGLPGDHDPGWRGGARRHDGENMLVGESPRRLPSRIVRVLRTTSFGSHSPALVESWSPTDARWRFLTSG